MTRLIIRNYVYGTRDGVFSGMSLSQLLDHQRQLQRGDISLNTSKKRELEDEIRKKQQENTSREAGGKSYKDSDPSSRTREIIKELNELPRSQLSAKEFERKKKLQEELEKLRGNSSGDSIAELVDRVRGGIRESTGDAAVENMERLIEQCRANLAGAVTKGDKAEIANCQQLLRFAKDNLADWLKKNDPVTNKRRGGIRENTGDSDQSEAERLSGHSNQEVAYWARTASHNFKMGNGAAGLKYLQNVVTLSRSGKLSDSAPRKTGEWNKFVKSLKGLPMASVDK